MLGIMAAILASLHMQTADDLFGGPQGSPRSDKLIAASVQWAEAIMRKIDNVFLAEGSVPPPRRSAACTSCRGRQGLVGVIPIFPNWRCPHIDSLRPTLLELSLRNDRTSKML